MVVRECRFSAGIESVTRLPRTTNHTVHELTWENWAKALAASRKSYAAAA